MIQTTAFSISRAGPGRETLGDAGAGPWILRFARVLPVAVAVMGFVACQSEAERLQGESIYHLDQAVKILERTAGNTQAAIVELDKYLVDHRDRMLEARARGRSLLRNMSVEEQDVFRRRGMEQTKVLRERLDTLARTYSDPPRVLQKIQEFM